MNRGFWALIVFLATSAVGSAAEKLATPPRALIRQAGVLAASVSAEGPQSLSAARMRYRRHNGRWWYWLPSEQWAIWDGSQWTAVGEDVGQTANVASTISRAPRQ
jgi:hypothetical protein